MEKRKEINIVQYRDLQENRALILITLLLNVTENMQTTVKAMKEAGINGKAISHYIVKVLDKDALTKFQFILKTNVNNLNSFYQWIKEETGIG